MVLQNTALFASVKAATLPIQAVTMTLHLLLINDMSLRPGLTSRINLLPASPLSRCPTFIVRIFSPIVFNSLLYHAL